MRRVSFLCILALLSLLFAAFLGGCGSGKKGGAEAPTATPTVPGNLQSQITGVTINDAGQPVVTFSLLDQNGAPLDPAAFIATSGNRLRFTIAQLGTDGEYTNYILSGTPPVPAFDSGGTFATVGNGAYTYTFKTNIKATTLWTGTANVQTLTHSVAGQISRSIPVNNGLTLDSSNVFQQAVNPYKNFKPNGSPVDPVIDVREIVSISACNACHNKLGAHGGTRREIALCILCHNPTATDPTTTNTIDMKSMIHKIHYGKLLPSNRAGGNYTIGTSSFATVGYPFISGDAVSTAVYPAYAGISNTPIECVKCHKKGTDLSGRSYGANVDNWKQSSPTTSSAAMDTCTTCHDTTTFDGSTTITVGLSAGLPAIPHTGGTQADDSQCNVCHPTGAVGADEYDATVVGAHTILEQSSIFTGINYQIISVSNAIAGQKPTVTFKITDKNGNPIVPSSSGSSFSLQIGYPATDYTNNNMGNFGQPLSQSLGTATPNGDGSYSITFTTAIPAGATGVGVIGIEGRKSYTLPTTPHKGTSTFSVGGASVQYYFDLASGAPVINPALQRRQSVDLDKCNVCHSRLSLHGANRVNSIGECVICHNADATDRGRRPANAPTGTVDNLAERPIDFKVMIHKIHTGENLASLQLTPPVPYVIYGFGGSVNDFSDVRYPQDTRNCLACHIDTSPPPFGLPLSAFVLGTSFNTGTNFNNDIDNLRTPPMTSVCTSCHDDTTFTSAHVAGNTATDPNTGQPVELCAQCHTTGLRFGPDFAHVPVQ